VLWGKHLLYPHPSPGFLARSRFPGTFVSPRSSYEQEPVQGRLDFQKLVDQFCGPLYRFAMSLTRAEADAADLVQETFLTWAIKGHQLQDLSKVNSWLFTTLHRSFLQSQRRLVRFPHLEITRILEVPLGTVKSRIARGLVQLKELLLRSVPPTAPEKKDA
jgi:DNA-directed RNA polymerase specialized sigma24 family protein